MGAAQARARLSRARARSCTRRRSAGGWSTREMPEQWTISLGESAEKLATIHDISREAQDEFAARSHRLAAAAWDEGRYDGLGRRRARTSSSSATRASGPTRRREAREPQARVREGRHGHGRQRLAAQRRRGRAAARRRGGGCGDRPRAAGADRRPRQRRRGPRRVRDRARRGGRRARSSGPASAGTTSSSPSSTRRSPRSRSPAWRAGPSSTPSRLNVNGGAIAIGHPLGASGVRILGTLAHELRRRGGGYGVASICIGVGQGLAVVLEA